MSYKAFLGVYATSYAIAQTQADLTINVDRLHESELYRDTIRTTILAHTGLTVSFGDCRLGWHDGNQIAFDSGWVESEVLRVLHRCGVICGPGALR